MKYKIKYATMDELNSWIKLVRLVSWNFPGLETEELLDAYKNTVIKNINRKSAICAISEDKVVGILLFSIKYNMLCCMAVHPDYRKRGIAKRMIKEMISNLDKSRDIIVDTFREEDPKGIAPRALYTSLGFEPAELIESFGYPNQRFVLRAK
ncbi:MAG: GNAT family N-acetyltransferase [Lachnospiraceae bacterium]|jgi:ribosomal protein S18 acetylase RimI-like enzyme|nr:GNAT family N-acetyltransferase [Lachnospiraceae bacterium]